MNSHPLLPPLVHIFGYFLIFIPFRELSLVRLAVDLVD